MSQKIRVMVIDDSPFFRTMLTLDLQHDMDIEIVGTAADGVDALSKVISLKPDVITVDVEMPKMNGIDFIKRLMLTGKTPCIVVTSSPVSAFDAMSAGAVDYIRKPDGATETFIEELCAKVKAANGSKPDAVHAAVKKRDSLKETTPPLHERLYGAESIIALGASTGGTDSLQVVLEQMPENAPPILVVQHMPPVFTKMYADRLDKVCKIKVVEATDGLRLHSGLCVIGAGEYHLTLKKDIKGYFISSKKGDKVSGHCPSVDVLFDSVAEVAGKNAVGAILTGMGADGADGLLKMRKAGAFTVGQDKETCVVYGMPMEAFNRGAVCQQSPLQGICSLLMAKVK